MIQTKVFEVVQRVLRAVTAKQNAAQLTEEYGSALQAVQNAEPHLAPLQIRK